MIHFIQIEYLNMNFLSAFNHLFVGSLSTETTCQLLGVLTDQDNAL